MNGVEFFMNTLTKLSHVEIELTARLYNHFLARSLSAKGMNLVSWRLPQLGNPHHQAYFFKFPDEEVYHLRV